MVVQRCVKEKYIKKIIIKKSITISVIMYFTNTILNEIPYLVLLISFADPGHYRDIFKHYNSIKSTAGLPAVPVMGMWRRARPPSIRTMLVMLSTGMIPYNIYIYI